MGQEKYAQGFKLTLHPELLNEPYKWKSPRVVFVNSMSDLFHKNVPEFFIRKVFEESGWNKTVAASNLGISRSTLYEKLKKYNIEMNNRLQRVVQLRNLAQKKTNGSKAKRKGDEEIGSISGTIHKKKPHPRPFPEGKG